MRVMCVMCVMCVSAFMCCLVHVEWHAVVYVCVFVHL